MSMGRKTELITMIATGAATAYSSAISTPEGAMNACAQAKRTAGSSTGTFTLQGGWPDSVAGTTTDWVDCDLASASIASAQMTELKTAASGNNIIASFPLYRLKFVAGGAGTFVIRVTFLSA